MSSSYSSLTVSQLLDALAAPTPAPGGGAAAALAAAAAASVLAMCAGVRPAGEVAPAGAGDVVARLHRLRRSLLDALDRDAAAYGAVIDARRLPRDDDRARAIRAARIAQAMTEATDTQREILHACRALVAEAEAVAAGAVPAARPDVAVALDLLRAAARGAARNVRANVARLADLQAATAITREVAQTGAEVDAEAARVLRALDAAAAGPARP